VHVVNQLSQNEPLGTDNVVGLSFVVTIKNCVHNTACDVANVHGLLDNVISFLPQREKPVENEARENEI
jgi:hypothetical protein